MVHKVNSSDMHTLCVLLSAYSVVFMVAFSPFVCVPYSSSWETSSYKIINEKIHPFVNFTTWSVDIFWFFFFFLLQQDESCRKTVHNPLRAQTWIVGIGKWLHWLTWRMQSIMLYTTLFESHYAKMGLLFNNNKKEHLFKVLDFCMRKCGYFSCWRVKMNFQQTLVLTEEGREINEGKDLQVESD